MWKFYNSFTILDNTKTSPWSRPTCHTRTGKVISSLLCPKLNHYKRKYFILLLFFRKRLKLLALHAYSFPLVNVFPCEAYLFVHCGTADRGSTLVQHLFHYLFVDCGTADRGSTFVKHLFQYLFVDCGTAGRGSTLVQHLFQYLFVDCGTADRGSTLVQHLFQYLFVDCGTADRGSTLVKHLFFPSSTVGLRTAVALPFYT